MKRFFSSLSTLMLQAYGGVRRISRFVPLPALIAVAVLGAGLIAIQTWSTVQLSRSAVTDVESAANGNIAKLFADRLRIFGEQAEMSEVEKKFQDLAMLNPAVRLYLVDSRGIVRVSPTSYGRPTLPFVDMQPIKAALARSNTMSAILGDDPHHITSRNPISVAPLRFRTSAAFVYVVLSPASRVSRTYTFLGFKLGALTAVLMSLGGLAIVGLLLGGVYAHYHSINANLAAISHDLRSPLGAIQGYLETILEKGDRLSAQERERFMSVALKSTRSAASLINDVHHLSKLEASEEEISQQPLDITDLLMDVLMSLKPASDAKRLRVESEIAPILPICVGNIELLERLVRNLLENAIRYTPEGGRIRVEVANASTAVRVTVIDSGIGIPGSELDKVGKAFFRGAGAARTAPGSGLGLSIAASIARLHGGELKILSRESEGTAIVFTVPALPARVHKARRAL